MVRLSSPVDSCSDLHGQFHSHCQLPSYPLINTTVQQYYPMPGAYNICTLYAHNLYIVHPLNSSYWYTSMSVMHIRTYLLHPAVNTALQPPSSITQEATTTTSVSVSWSQVPGATGYYVSYQRQDLGAPPVVTPQYERIVGGDNTSVTLSGLKPGTTYRIRVWSTDGTSVSSGTGENDVTTMESGE